MKKTKIIVSIISIVLVLAIFAGLTGYLSGGFKNWNVKDWFGKNDTPQEESKTVTVDFNVKTLCEGEDGEDWVNNKLTEAQVHALKKCKDTTIEVQPVDCVNYVDEEKPVTEPFTLKFFNMIDEDGVIVGYSDTGFSEGNVMICFAPLDLEFSQTFPEGYYFISSYVGNLKFSITYNEDEKGLIESVFDMWGIDEDDTERLVIDFTDEENYSTQKMADERTCFISTSARIDKIVDFEKDMVLPPLKTIAVNILYPATEDTGEMVAHNVALYYSYVEGPIMDNSGSPIAWLYSYTWTSLDGNFEYKVVKGTNSDGSFLVEERLVSETRCKIIIE